uniref:Ig-like domain-containing protein n=1 Tax=Gadus morhua TaxID=8049 RepID=A0A8C5FEV0_GADMO
MKMLFLLLAFPFFFKVCTGLLLSGEVGGTVLFQCNSIKMEIKSMSFQGGTAFKKVIIGYHAPTNKTEVLRPDTFLNNVDKTVSFGNLTVSDEGTYKCIINHATPDTVTLERRIPVDVSNASLTCTAIEVYPVSKISWNVSGVLEHQWENIVTQDKNSLLFNISSTAFFNCSDKSARLIKCSLGGVSSDEKSVCQQPKGEFH